MATNASVLGRSLYASLPNVSTKHQSGISVAETIAELRRGRGAGIRGLMDMIVRAPDVVAREAIR